MGSVGSGPVPSTAGGDAMGLRVYTLPDGGTRFEMWFRISGVWILKIAYNDLYKIGPQGNGYIGVSINTAWPGTPFFDDFGGGSITIPNNPMNDAYPTYNSTLNNTLSRRAWPEPKTAGTVTKPRPVAGQIWPRRK